LQNPDQIAAKLFPREAAANPTIFYANGQARTIREVYHALVAKHNEPAGLHPGFAVQQMATVHGLPVKEGNSRPVTADVADAPEIPSRFGPQDMSFKSLFSTDETGATGSPVQSVDEAQGAAFFTQLYGQH
jgi:hypothetical protein